MLARIGRLWGLYPRLACLTGANLANRLDLRRNGGDRVFGWCKLCDMMVNLLTGKSRERRLIQAVRDSFPSFRKDRPQFCIELRLAT